MRPRLLLISLSLATGCGRHPEPGSTGDTMVHTLAPPDLPPPDLPDEPGRTMLVGACSTCHTLRYVLDQPPLTRGQWAAEVDKMRHAYGAPFPDELTAPIVDYLVAIRGNR